MQAEALPIHQELGSKVDEASDYLLIGDILSHRGDLGEAAEAYEKALRLYEELRQRDVIVERRAAVLHSLGKIHERQGNLDRVRDLWEAARDLYTSADNTEKAEEVSEALRLLGSRE